MQNNGSWLDPHWTAGRAKRNFQVNIGDGGDHCIPTGAVWSDTKSFTGSKEEVIAAGSRVALRNLFRLLAQELAGAVAAP